MSSEKCRVPPPASRRAFVRDTRLGTEVTRRHLTMSVTVNSDNFRVGDHKGVGRRGEPYGADRGKSAAQQRSPPPEAVRRLESSPEGAWFSVAGQDFSTISSLYFSKIAKNSSFSLRTTPCFSNAADACSMLACHSAPVMPRPACAVFMSRPM